MAFTIVSYLESGEVQIRARWSPMPYDIRRRSYSSLRSGKASDLPSQWGPEQLEERPQGIRSGLFFTDWVVEACR
jgi:hypothetical protein